MQQKFPLLLLLNLILPRQINSWRTKFQKVLKTFTHVLLVIVA